MFFHDRDPESLPLALKVAQWTIENMQDRSGYFYYRRYSPWLVNKTPTLHWGQATMLCALARTLQTALRRRGDREEKVLIIVENLPVPFDTRVWKEAFAA